MIYYTLENDVFLVKGAKRACLYDLRRGNLYTLDEHARDFVRSFETTNIVEKELTSRDRICLETLLSESLIKKTDKPIPAQDIKSLVVEHKLRFAWIEVTRQCNLSCAFCYEGSNPSCTERLSFEEFQLITDNLKEVGVKEIQFIGGEPTILRDQFKAMIVHARNDFDFIEVYSNGVLINEEWCRFFKEHHVHIALSIHSYIPEEHDRVTTKKGSHKRVMKALELLKRYEISYRIGAVKTQHCKIGVPDENSSYRLTPKPAKATGLADIDAFDLDIFKEKAITKDSKRAPITKQQIITALSGHQCFIKDLYINCSLDVFPCVMERRISHGNLRTHRLKDIIDNKIRYLSKDNISGCKDCEYRYACFDCRPDFTENDPYGKPLHCTYNPSEGVWCDVKQLFNKLKKRRSSTTHKSIEVT